MRTFSITLILAAAVQMLAGAAQAGAVRDIGFDRSMPTWLDDASSGSIPTGFQLNFGGTWYQSINISTEGLLSWGYYADTRPDFPQQPVIAPFHADVDTRVGGVVLYGLTTVDGHRAVGATWQDVAGHGTAGRNSFQVLLIERADSAVGDFDIEFNYDQIGWDDAHGARAGWQSQFWNGQRYVWDRYELEGSAVAGAYLDGGPNALTANHFNADVDGRYVFAVRGGQVNTVLAPVPEPSALWMSLAGLGLLGFVHRRSARAGQGARQGMRLTPGGAV